MNSQSNPFEKDLARTAANHVPLTPLGFIERTAAVYPERVAVIHGKRRYQWKETYARCRRLASALAKRGIGAGDTVAVMLANTPEMYECHFGVPMTGGVLNALNTRLDAEAIAFMLEHGGAKLLITDREFSPTVKAALALLKTKPAVIDVDDSEYSGPGERLGGKTYEDLLGEGDPAYAWQWPSNEWNAICLGYTSGTTGDPKGVVYHHRGAYLNAICNIVTWGMPHHAVYLWTLPMFHCSGWTFPWTMAANAGTNVCLRKVDAGLIFKLIKEHRVTHYCGAPIVHSTLINAPEEMKQGISHQVKGMVAAAAPPAAMIEGMEKLGFDITHVYGLTEVYGPATVCAKQEEWNALDIGERTRLNGRQGVRYLMEEGLSVMDPETMQPVPADGETMGEIMFRGNITMKGYLKNPSATEKAFAGGWFHSGDLGVMYPDGYLKIKDRSKDIIISGGENISSLEVEDVLYRHPAVVAAAVVAMPDEKWGETPCAFVELKPGTKVDEKELIDFCRSHMAKFKAPRAVVFGEVPKTSTGKIQKFVLREKAKSANAIDNEQPALLREDRDGIATLTLNRPAQMNLLTAEMLTALQDAFNSIEKNPDIRVVVLAASGKGFCAGHDLKEIRALGDQAKIAGLFTQCSRMMMTIPKLPQPVIAKVQGAAAAAGAQLVAQCDLAVAVDTAKFVTSGVSWGFFCSTPGVAIGRNLQRKHAMEMLLTGEPISAQRALEWGLVNRVVAADALDGEVLSLAKVIAAKPPATVAAGKRGFYQQMDMDVAHAYELAGQVISSDFAHPEGREGASAFIEKRDPSWKK